MTDVRGFNRSGQSARRLEYQTIIKHLNLDFRTLYIVGSVAASVDNHFLNHKLWVIPIGYKLSMLSKATRI